MKCGERCEKPGFTAEERSLNSHLVFMLFMHASKELLTLSPEILMSLEAFTFSEENTYVCLIDPINTHRQFADHNVRAAADMSLSGFSWAQT